MKREDLKPTLINGKRDDIAEGLSRRSLFMRRGRLALAPQLRYSRASPPKHSPQIGRNPATTTM